MNNLNFDKKRRVVLDHYQQGKPFTSFLPGVAGLKGIPMWVFYVNRGQGITSFGIRDKDHAILEFQPANRAYQFTPQLGFRTFIRLDGGEMYEPFKTKHTNQAQPSMFIGMNELEIEDHSPHGLQTNVLYYTLSNEPLAGLVRQVTITNTSSIEIAFEMLDGLPVVIPYGVDNGSLKHMGRTIEAWMQVDGLSAGLAFYKLQATSSDSPEVQKVDAGNFAFGFLTDKEKTILLTPLVDPWLIFGQDTAFSQPEGFISGGLQTITSQKQITAGRSPCAFFGGQVNLLPGESIQLCSIFGYAPHQDTITQHMPGMQSDEYLVRQRSQANALTEEITAPIEMHSGIPEWDAYCRQTFLDNLLRGGMPVFLGRTQKHVAHIYSRKHGDPERDYNYFSLSPEYYSQGNGNYRDVNQNRRSDVFFFPEVGDHNVRKFVSLIQLDGYNPLVLSGNTYTLSVEHAAALAQQFDLPEDVKKLITSEFSPGELMKVLENNSLNHPVFSASQEQVFHEVFEYAQAQVKAEYGEGYWIDHWAYNLDLIESYLAIYPENKAQLYFETEIPIFNSPAVVLPRSRRFVATPQGPRQYHAVLKDETKIIQIAKQGNWVHTKSGTIAHTTIFARLYMLAWLKTATLDPYGMGLEMEAGKPGWYDALNGLPGLLGSSMPETYQLARLVQMLKDALAERGSLTVRLPEEIGQFISKLAPEFVKWLSAKPGAHRDLVRWNTAADGREEYREQIRVWISGKQVEYPKSQIIEHLNLLEKLIHEGLARAATYTTAAPLTYFYYTITKATPSGSKDLEGREFIIPQAFDVKPLALFLEGPVQALRQANSISDVRRLHQAVLDSPLYDKKLKMFKVNGSLAEEPHEIGRARAFPPGWLENESIWLHMEYKYLLELLKGGGIAEFWQAAEKALIPFQNLERYGRSPLENVSFIASSAHADENLHGAGFVARLSGSTAEFLSIWFTIMTGGEPFTCSKDGELMLALRPALPAWLFSDEGTIRFTFLGATQVVYNNPHKLDTWQAQVEKYVLRLVNGQVIEVKGPMIPAPYAAQVRAGEVTEITVELKSTNA